MTDIDFKNQEEPILTDKTIIHENDSFSVQWVAMNTTNSNIKPFDDGLVITSIPEGCPGTDGADHPVVFDSSTDGRASDYTEASLPAGAAGSLMQPTVGPFPVGSYRLTVTLDRDLGRGATQFLCIDIVPAT
jgi:hypothetical protein